MKTSWMIGLATIFMVGTLLSGILEMQYLSGSADQVGVMRSLFTIPQSSIGGVWGVIVGTAMVIGNFLVAVWNTLWWNYAFFQDTAWEIVRYAICWPISVGFILSIVSMFRGASSS